MSDPGLNILPVSVGNTNTHFAVAIDGTLGPTTIVSNRDPAAVARQIAEAAGRLPKGDSTAVVIASVNDSVATPVAQALSTIGSLDVYRIGQDLPIPIDRATDPRAATGQDRLLNALAAFEIFGQACVIVDAGTAVTVDFVDGAGVFQGGAIAPGFRTSLKAMHDFTAALPLLEPAAPEADESFPRNTEQAMLCGVYYGIRGLVRSMTERFAEAYEAYPLVVATGGDAALIFSGDELVERIVPDLTLRGILAACRKVLHQDEAGL